MHPHQRPRRRERGAGALRCNVKKVVALSTDKAANPINLYGATKLASDKIFVAANNLSGEPRHAVLGGALRQRGGLARLGGSAVPAPDPRRRQGASDHRPAHDAVLDHARAGRVDSCCRRWSMMRGGEIFVPKIPSMRIIDLAQTLAPDLPHEDRRHPAGREAARGDDHRGRCAHDARTGRPLRHRAADRGLVKAEHLLDAGARPVAEGFRYASDTNADWLDEQAMVALIGRKAA